MTEASTRPHQVSRNPASTLVPDAAVGTEHINDGKNAVLRAARGGFHMASTGLIHGLVIDRPKEMGVWISAS